MNARDEFLEFIKDLPGVVCAEIKKPETRYSSELVGVGAPYWVHQR